jgi:hypothetical protein
MTIYYLMVKTHKITGLKYLCQTKRKDPYRYLGSGTHWTRHLNKHGKDITTEIIRECQSKDELTEWGLHYSEMWNIVNVRDTTGKKVWANLMPESGTGGSTSEIQRRPSTRAKRSSSLKGNVPWNKGKKIGPASLESKAKNSASNKGNKNGRFGKGILKSSTVNMRKPKSDSHAKNIGLARQGYKYKTIKCLHCNKQVGINVATRYHFDNCKWLTGGDLK